MKIVNYLQPKSSFLSVDKDMNLIVNRILENERLCKMLYYSSADALKRRELTEEEKLSMFGKNIKNLGQNMYSTMQAAQQRMNAVSEGWQDKQNDKFREQFDRSVQDIKKMSEMFTEYSNYIAKITSKLMEYQSIR